jgi:xanthine dehydrogenase YagR molybdenum-binding subunit
VRAAAIEIKRQLLVMAAEDLKVDASSLACKGEEIVSKIDPSKKIKISEVSRLKKMGLVVGVGYRDSNPEGKVVNPFAAQFCEVEVNTRTGEVKIIRFVGAHESGRVMNQLTYDNQVIGGITMGIGFGMTEVRVLDRNQTGKLVNKNLHDYKLPTALDVPADIVSVRIEPDDREANTTGAKGLGEPVTIPTAAALANAIYNATGIRITQTPINPLQLVQLLSENRKEG